MMITVYAVFNTLLYFSITLALITLLHRRTALLARWSVSILLLAFALSVARLFLPLDLYAAHVIYSRTFLPAVWGFFRTHPGVGYFLLAVWGVGAAVVGLRDLLILLRAHRAGRSYAAVKDSLAEQTAQRLGAPCPVVTSPDVDVPYVSGIVRHTIYLPAAELTREEMEAVLLHESQHIRSHDAQIKFFFGFVSALLWWVPFVYPFRNVLDDILELRCDEEVTRGMDEAGRMAYLEMLLGMMKRLTANWPPALAADGTRILGKRPNIMRQRFERILSNMDKPPRRMGVALPCFLAALFLASFLVLIQPGGLPPAEDFEEGYTYVMGSKEDEDSTFILKRLDGRYELYIHSTLYKDLSIAEISADRYKDIPIYYEEADEP